jgi:uncharacterized coiled-coil DUF342 family protein
MDPLYTDALKELEEVKAERDEYRDHLAAIAEMTGNAVDIGAAHEGVNALVEDLARHKRMFAAACETLGEIQQALGNSIVGIEPVLVKELIEERDALAAHVDRLKSALDNILSEVGTHSHDDLSDDERKALSALEATPATSLARRDVLKHAEALEEAAADTVPAMHKMKHWLLSRANDLRQQAEGHQ